MTNLSKLKSDIEIVQRALSTESLEPKTCLDYDAMTEQEKLIVKGATDLCRAAMRRGVKEQNVATIGDVDMSKVYVSEEDQPIIDAYSIIFQKYGVTPKEYSRRYPIH